MVDWSDNAVRATVAVVIINVGLLAAISEKDSRAALRSSQSAVKGGMPWDGLSREKYAAPQERTCLNILDWTDISKNYPTLAKGLQLSNAARPCLMSKGKFENADTANEVATAAGLPLTFVQGNGTISFQCVRDRLKVLKVEAAKSVSKNDVQDAVMRREDAKLFCAMQNVELIGDDK